MSVPPIVPLGSSTAELNSPNLPLSGPFPEDPPVRAIKDAKQAAEIARKLEQDNVERNLKNARIMSRYNSERPWDQGRNEVNGLGWKSNFSTMPLPTLVDKVGPRFVAAVESAKYLTSSALPDNAPGASAKTELFRKGITELIRSRPEWTELLGEIAQENALFGYTAVGWLDEYEWFPEHFRGDRFYVPPGTKQHADRAQLVYFTELLPVDKAFERIRDRRAAEDSGYKFPEVIEAINEAVPQSVRSRHTGEWARVYEDLTREVNVGTSMYSDSKLVRFRNLLVVEVTGKVTHLRLDENYKLVFERYDRFENMSEAASFFSFQQANGTLHGSKGIGRLVYNMAQILDRARNEVVDRLQLSGKLVVTGDEKQIKRFRMGVFGNAILIPSIFQLQQQQIQPNVEPFFELDRYMTQLLDQIAGNVSPRQLEGERVTAQQVAFFAAREEEAKDTVIARFMKQVATMVNTMQRRICSDRCDSEDAKAFREDMLLHMTPEELDQLAKMPSAMVVKDLTDQERQEIIIVASENIGNPMVDQQENLRRKLTAQVSAEFAEAVMLPVNDPNVTAEQIRQQQSENLLLATGEPVGVSARDRHLLHLEGMESALQSAVDSLVENPGASEIVKNYVDHARGHVQMGMATGQDKAEYQSFALQLQQIDQALAQLKLQEDAIKKAVESGVPPAQAAQMVASVPTAVEPPAGAPPPPPA